MDEGVDAKQNWTRLLEDLHQKGIKDIVFGGDIGDPSAHAWFFESLRPFATDIILGNHDRYDQVSKYFVRGDDSQELFYTKEDESYKCIFLDTSLECLSQTQLQWLKQELDSLKKLVIFIHHPVLAVNTKVDQLYPLHNREEVQAVLIESGKPITIFCGHYHMNHESTFENITQIITMAASYQIVRQAVDVTIDVAKFGYRVIQLDPAGISTTPNEFCK